MRDLFQTPGADVPRPATLRTQMFSSSVSCNMLECLAFHWISISAELPDRTGACAGIGRAVHMYHIKVHPPALTASIFGSVLRASSGDLQTLHEFAAHVLE